MAWPPPLMDDFTGSNGSIDGRTVSAGGYTWEAPALSGHVAAQISSNALAGLGGEDRSALIVEDIAPDCQVACRIVTTAGNPVYLYASIQEDSFPVVSGNFYYLKLLPTADADTWQTFRVVSGSGTRITAGNGFEWASGDEAGMELVEAGGQTVINVYRKPSGGSWSLISTGYDSNASRATGAGHVGIEIDNGAWVIEDFRFSIPTGGGGAGTANMLTLGVG